MLTARKRAYMNTVSGRILNSQIVISRDLLVSVCNHALYNLLRLHSTKFCINHVLAAYLKRTHLQDHTDKYT